MSSLFDPEPAPVKTKTKRSTNRGNLGTWRKVYIPGAYHVKATDSGLTLTVPYAPSANHYWRKTKQGRVYVSEDAKAYREELIAIFPLKPRPLTGPVSVTYKVYRPIKRGDLSNVMKVLDDALNGLAWADDDQIAETHAYRFEDKDFPRIEMIIQALPEPVAAAKPARVSRKAAA